ncbi:hypothetical protein PINS_up008659 [Pythium insidiosum]|nr:hypothetical protein PINS_up008659 [Pythium insidiosum]
MPIDINKLRKERGGDPEAVKLDQKKRFASVDLVDQVVALDEEWRKKQGEVETLQMKVNALQNQIKELSKAKQDFKAIAEERKVLAAQVPELKQQADALKEKLDQELNKIANYVDPTVPISNNEDDNAVVREWGTPRQQEGLHFHHEVLHRIDGYEPERGVNVAGHRAYFLTGYGFLLEQALMSYATAFLMKRQYKMLKPPFFMNKEMMAGVAQLDDFDEQLYKVIGEDEKYLIATSEQPICGLPQGRVDSGEPAAASLRWLLDVLPKGGWLARQGHVGYLPRAPVRQDRAVLYHGAGEVGRDARGDDQVCGGVLPVAAASVPRDQHRLG